jgi:hypothetical protein
MMNMMGPMFGGFGMFPGVLLVLFVPGVIFLGAMLLRGLKRRSRRGELAESEPDMQSMHSKIMRLALDKGGTLTVTDVVMETGLSIKEAEETLSNMVDGLRIKMEVRDSGIIVYEFPEIMRRTET